MAIVIYSRSYRLLLTLDPRTDIVIESNDKISRGHAVENILFSVLVPLIFALVKHTSNLPPIL